MSRVDPVWKFCELLDRLVVNDKRFIDCLTSLARDFPYLAQFFMENFEAKFAELQDNNRKLYFFYVLDSLSFNLLNMRDIIASQLSQLFEYAYCSSDPATQQRLESLLSIWEREDRFPAVVLDDVRVRIAPIPPHVSSPVEAHDFKAFFNLEEVGEWLSHHSNTPAELLPQASGEKTESLFDKLLLNECSKIEFENLSMKLAMVNERDYPRKLIIELYEELTRQCLICGVRFGLDSELDNHLDFHFKRNNRHGPPLAWLPEPEQWVEPKLSLGLIEDDKPTEKVEEKVFWAPCNPRQLKCELCGEKFDIQPNEYGWYCKDSIRVLIECDKRELILHMSCVKSISNEPSAAAETVNFQYVDSFV